MRQIGSFIFSLLIYSFSITCEEYITLSWYFKVIYLLNLKFHGINTHKLILAATESFSAVNFIHSFPLDIFSFFSFHKIIFCLNAKWNKMKIIVYLNNTSRNSFFSFNKMCFFFPNWVLECPILIDNKMIFHLKWKRKFKWCDEKLCSNDSHGKLC